MQMELGCRCGRGVGVTVALLSESLAKKGQVFFPDPAILFAT